MGGPRSRIPHDRGGFFFLLRLPRGGDGRFLPILVEIMVAGGGYTLLCAVAAGVFSDNGGGYLGRGRRLRIASPLPCFPAK
jgi:hypothetical protein